MLSSSLSRSSCGAAPFGVARPSACRRVVSNSSKGFGAETSTSPKAEKASPSEQELSSVDAIEAQIRNRREKRQGKIEPQVKVKAPVVDAVTGKTPATAASQIESAAVLGLFYFFLLIMVEGLMLAGSGFLPEETDQWIQSNIYPGYSATVVLFLGCSSLYGLFKTGKLPGQKQL